MAASSSSPISQGAPFQAPAPSPSRYGRVSLILNSPSFSTPYRESSLTVVEAKVGGTAIGSLYQKNSKKPDKIPSRYLGKIGIGKGIYTNDPHTYRTRTKLEMNSDVICEKIAYDFYDALGESAFITPKTYLSRQPIADLFTRFHPLVLFLLGTPAQLSQAGFSALDAPPDEHRLSNESLRIMSFFIPGYQDFENGTALLEGAPVNFIDYIARAHRPPDSLLTPEGREVPIRGLVALLAVGRVLADTDVIGGSGGNAGFIWIRDERGEIVAAQTVKIDPGMAFQFGVNDEANWAANTHYQRRTRSAKQLDDIRDLQIAQNYDPITIHWESLTPSQKIEFLKTFYLSSRLIRSEEALHYLFYREGRFNRSETEQYIESEARRCESQLRDWVGLQEGIYEREMVGKESELIESITSNFGSISQEEQLEVLNELLLSFPNLTKLKLSALKVSDEALLGLVQRAQHLEELILISSQSITKEGLIALLNSHPRLALTLSDQHRINGAELAELIEFAWDPRDPRTLSFLLDGVKAPLLEARRDLLLRESLISRRPSLLLGEALLIRGATITPLLLKEVVEEGSGAALQLLADRYPDIKEVRIQGESLLHHGARANRGDQIRLLLVSSFDEINLRGALERTPLHVAAQHGSVDAARALLECGADPMLVDSDLKTVLHLAIHPLPTLAMVQLLLGVDREVFLNRDSAPAPVYLTQWQTSFLEMGGRIAPEHRLTPPLLTRWQKQLLNQRDEAEVLFSSLTDDQQELLRLEGEALWREGLALIQATPLALNPWQRELLVMGDSDGKVPLHFAALQRDPHLALLLLRAGTPPNTTNSHGYTALHWAAMYNLPETAEILLIGGARTEILNRNQETPFSLALRFGGHQAARLLISPQLIATRGESPTSPLPTVSSSSSSAPTQTTPSQIRGGGDIEAILALEDRSRGEVEREEYLLASTILASAFRMAEELAVPKSYLDLLELQLDRIATSFLLKQLETKTKSSHTCQISLHREQLKRIRSDAEQIEAIQPQQAALNQGYRKLLSALFAESFDLIDEAPPSKYALLALDQLSRGEGFPIAEIRFALVVENPNAVPFFEKVAQLLEIKISNLGESGRGFGLQIGGERSIVGTAAQVAESLGTSLHTTLLAGDASCAKKQRDCSNKIMGWDRWFGPVEGEAKATTRLSLSLDRWRELQGESSVQVGLYRPFEAALRYLQLYFRKSLLSPREAIQALPFRSGAKRALSEAFNRASSLVVRSQFAQLRREEFLPDPREVAAIRATLSSLYAMIGAFIARPGKEALDRALLTFTIEE